MNPSVLVLRKNTDTEGFFGYSYTINSKNDLSVGKMEFLENLNKIIIDLQVT